MIDSQYEFGQLQLNSVLFCLTFFVFWISNIFRSDWNIFERTKKSLKNTLNSADNWIDVEQKYLRWFTNSDLELETSDLFCVAWRGRAWCACAWSGNYKCWTWSEVKLPFKKITWNFSTSDSTINCLIRLQNRSFSNVTCSVYDSIDIFVIF